MFSNMEKIIAAPAPLQEVRVDRTVIRSGAHPWYEVKADPTAPQNLIVCGTKLDTILDAPIGFVYSSIDEGRTWRTALEDRSSLWVTEQSCAFGQDHRAYFISEASKVISGRAEHERGTTRLYVSTDSGQNWTETIKTGWADFSTSAVNSVSGKLFTFYNSIAGVPGRTWGSNVGLLLFSKDGKTVEGPFFDPELQDLGYDGIFPSAAVSLKNGTVLTLYYATKATRDGSAVDLGVLRAHLGELPLLSRTLILHAGLERNCLKLNDASLAYDSRSNKLFILYVDGCRQRDITLISSNDEGRTWSSGRVIAKCSHADNPSLIVTTEGKINVLWQDGEGSARWLFSQIEEEQLLQPTTELSQDRRGAYASSDSLETWIYQSGEHHGTQSSEPAITVNVVNMLNVVWKSFGLAATPDGLVAVWPSGDDSGMQLYFGRLIETKVGRAWIPPVNSQSDVTDDIVVLYGGKQHVDLLTGNLDVCLKLGNRSNRNITEPITLEAAEIESPGGVVAAVNATNGQTGKGAVWDISEALTGRRIPPRSTSNSFCLSFRLSYATQNGNPSHMDDLLVLKLRVFALTEPRVPVPRDSTRD
jgi:hypothetical protein